MDKQDKYEYTGNQRDVPLFNKTIKINEIRALRDIPSIGVRKGDIGGHIWSESSLSQYGASWVFPGSVVHSGGRVLGDAVAYGNSIVSSNSVLEGKCRVEDSNILNTSVIGGDAHIESSRITETCLISGDVKLKNAQLYSVVVNSGIITDSMIRSKNGLLRIEKAVFFNRTRLTIEDEHPVMEEQSTMHDVTGEGFDSFKLLGRCRFDKVTFPTGTKLFVALPVDPMDYSIIESVDGDCRFEELDLYILNSLIRGAVFLKGRLKLTDSMLFENTSVLNDSPNYFALSEVKLRELATIHYKGSAMEFRMHGISIMGDTFVAL